MRLIKKSCNTIHGAPNDGRSIVGHGLGNGDANGVGNAVGPAVGSRGGRLVSAIGTLLSQRRYVMTSNSG